MHKNDLHKLITFTLSAHGRGAIPTGSESACVRDAYGDGSDAVDDDADGAVRPMTEPPMLPPAPPPAAMA